MRKRSDLTEKAERTIMLLRDLAEFLEEHDPSIPRGGGVALVYLAATMAMSREYQLLYGVLDQRQRRRTRSQRRAAPPATKMPQTVDELLRRWGPR